MDVQPSRPIVSTLAAAEGEIARWLAENRYETLKDADGTPWNLTVDSVQSPHPNQTHAIHFDIRLLLDVTLTAEELQRSHVLDATADQRLLTFVEERPIPMQAIPATKRADHEDHVRSFLADSVPSMAAWFREVPVAEVKRKMIGVWVDRMTSFHGQAAVPMILPISWPPSTENPS